MLQRLLPLTTLAAGLLLATPLMATDKAAYDKQAIEVTKQLVQQLGKELKAAIKQDGPVAAIKVCKDKAPEIARDLSLEKGWKITRVSQRVRNALLGTPDAWERAQLEDFDARRAAGEDLSKAFNSAVFEEGGQTYYRFTKPIVTGGLCLTCHGDDNTIPAPVKAALDEAYPQDAARGYQVGDVRGAVSIKRPL